MEKLSKTYHIHSYHTETPHQAATVALVFFSIGNVVSHQSHHGFLSQLWLCRGSRRHWPPRGRVSDCLRPNQTSECCGDFIDVFFGVMRTCVIGSLLMLIIMARYCRVCYYGVVMFVVGGVAVAAVLLFVVLNVVLSVVIVTVLVLTSWGDHALHSDLNFRYRPSHQFPERIRCHLGTRHDTTDRSREGTGNEEMTWNDLCDPNWYNQ